MPVPRSSEILLTAQAISRCEWSTRSPSLSDDHLERRRLSRSWRAFKDEAGSGGVGRERQLALAADDAGQDALARASDVLFRHRVFFYFLLEKPASTGRLTPVM